VLQALIHRLSKTEQDHAALRKAQRSGRIKVTAEKSVL
jgi:hypothetical protein